MYAVDFEFANQRLSDYGCVVCHINTNSDIREVDIGCDITFTTLKNNNSSKNYVTGSSYDNVYTATFDIMKYSCNDFNDKYMTSLEVRSIMKWLNRRGYYKFRIVNEIADESDVHYYGSFNVEQIIVGDKIVGLTLTFTSNAPFGFSNLTELKYMCMSGGEEFVIYGDSDDIGVIYPVVKVKCFNGGEIKITNNNTGNFILLSNCETNETITIDGEHKIITTDNNEHKETLPNDFNYEYFEIIIDEYDSANIYEVSSPCEISVYYSPIRKVGVY